MLSHAEDIPFLRVLCVFTAKVAVTSGRQGGGKLELGSAELKLARQGREISVTSVALLSMIVAYQQRQATWCFETREHTHVLSM
jgi:hypothetical protein